MAGTSGERKSVTDIVMSLFSGVHRPEAYLIHLQGYHHQLSLLCCKGEVQHGVQRWAPYDMPDRVSLHMGGEAS